MYRDLLRIAKDHQAELRVDAQRNHLKNTAQSKGSFPLDRNQASRLFVRVAFALIAISLLAIFLIQA